MPERRPLHEMTLDLVAVAAGRRPADLVIRNGRWVNVHSGEILEGSTVAISGCRIAACGPDVDPAIGPETTVLDAGGRYLVPGLLDAHVHVESSMMTVGRFAGAVLPRGTTGAFIDPHEIANVHGLDGVRWMAEEARTTPMKIYVQIPSCVPAAPGLETNGATIGPEDVAEAMTWDGVIGLGEVMNYPGVAFGDEAIHARIAAALKGSGVIGGHYASDDLGAPFRAYAAGGPSDCHEGTRPEDVAARVRLGMAAIIREGTACRNVAAQARAVTEDGIDPRRVLLCTDDRHPGTLLHEGHMDDVVRKAIRAGIRPMTAIQMATLNTAEHFGVARDVGSIAPCRYADLLIVDDLEEMVVDEVIAAGEVVARGGRLIATPEPFAYPPKARASVAIPAALVPADFEVRAPDGVDAVACRVIRRIEAQVLTEQEIEIFPVESGAVVPQGDVAYLAVVERHRGTGRIGRGFVRGFGLEGRCALASTVAHDSHNLLVLGSDLDAMAAAAKRVVKIGGGIALVRDGRVIAQIDLPIAGLMSDAPVADVAARTDVLQRALGDDCGCRVSDALTALSFLALPVIPRLRLTDLGLVDVDRFEIVSLFVDDDNPLRKRER